MNPYKQMAETARRTRKTLYIVAGLYVAVGFVVLVGAALAGDPLSAFLGFLIVSGALAVAILVSSVLRLSARLSAIDEGLADIRAQLDRIENSRPLAGTLTAAMPADGDPDMLDLAAIGLGDPASITAATLDRDVFPRLVKTMHEAPPPEPAGPGGRGAVEHSSSGPRQPDTDPTARAENETDGRAVSLKNLIRTWK